MKREDLTWQDSFDCFRRQSNAGCWVFYFGPLNINSNSSSMEHIFCMLALPIIENIIIFIYQQVLGHLPATLLGSPHLSRYRRHIEKKSSLTLASSLSFPSEHPAGF